MPVTTARQHAKHRIRCTPAPRHVTVEDVAAFFNSRTKTKAGALKLFYELGVRFNKNGTVRNVVSL